MTTRPRVLLSWSSGKDSAWALHVLQRSGDVDVVGLLTTFNEEADRVAMHAVRRRLAEAQALATGLPLWSVPLPFPCSNEDYEKRMGQAIDRARQEGIDQMAFGDLFLEDVRDYRLQLLASTGIEPIFPIWCSAEETPQLARQMLAEGFQATLTCVDPKALDPSFVGREFDARLLDDLPSTVDPCGERGEFHTFCHRGPIFDADIPVQTGTRVHRDGFEFCDLTLREPTTAGS